MTRSIALTALATSLLLAACSREPAGDGNGQDASVTAVDANKTPPRDWNAVDACGGVDKAAMAAVVGQQVTETRLGNVHESDGTTSATSECTYVLADGGTATLMLRWSPIADNNEGSINAARSALEQTLKGFGGKLETVDSLGKAAFWAGMTKSLNVFIAEDKFAIITMPPSANAKDQAVALARKLGA